MIKKLMSLLGNLNIDFKWLMPYMSFIAVILCLINFFFLVRVQSEIKNVHRSVNSISTDYDNSDVISAVEDAESNIIGSIEDAEDEIRRNIIIWGN